MAKLTSDITAQGYRVRGVWQGGAYIELHFIIPGTTARYREPFNVNNVYDYGTGTTDYPFTVAGLKAAMQDWKSDLYDGEIDDYAQNVSVQAGGIW